MIGWGDVYKVVAAMAPLYFALGLGYGSVRWWRFFTAEQCAAINTMVVYFSMPFFTFDFVVRTDPFAMNYRVIAADAVSKAIAIAAMAAWARTRCGCAAAKAGAQSWSITGFSLAALNNTLVVGVPLLDAMYGRWAQDLVVQIAVVQSMVWFPLLLMAFELRKAWVVLARNPNVYASVLGVVWACIAYRWHLSLPGIVTGSLQQERVIACGAGLTALGMALRFVAGPLATLVGAAALGLRGDVLHLAIIQAALPQSIASFVFAKEYGLHADVLSTAVIFGTLISLPILIAYYAVLGFV
uniref:Auxin efflux carrier component n=1 Tax=Oryza glumipatula TaxID=40148 RepID=A0A0E0AXZ7_9ORYZ